MLDALVELHYYINPEVTDYYVCWIVGLFVCGFVCVRLTPQKMLPTQYARTVRYDVLMRSCVWYGTVRYGIVRYCKVRRYRYRHDTVL